MRSKRVTTDVAGGVTRRLTLLSFLAAGALAACGGSSPSPKPPVTLQSIAVTPGTSTIAAGTTQQFTATGTFSDGTTGAVSGLTWTSSDTAIATVDATGLASAVAGTKGTATITATSGGVSGRSSITVTVAPLTSVTVAAVPGPLASVPVGLTQQFAAVGHFADGTTARLTSGVEWVTNDVGTTQSASGASVDAAGLVTARAVGQYDVVATDTASALSGKATLTVSAAVLQSIALTPNVSVAQGFSSSLAATGTFSDGVQRSLAPASLVWASNDTAIATVVASSGLVRGVGTGAVVITATDPASAVVGQVSVTVTAATLQSIAISPAPTATVAANAHLQFTATGIFSNSATPVALGDADLIWSSSDTAVATMNGGLALGVAPAGGTTNITAAARVGNVVSQATVLTVTPPPPFVTIDAATQLAFSGSINAGGANRYRVINLGVSADQLVFLTAGTGPVDAVVFTDSGFATVVPTTFGLSVFRGAVSSNSGEIFVEVSGAPGDTFTLDVRPLPVLQAGVPFSGSVAQDFAYFKVIGLTPGTAFDASLNQLLADADLFVFDNPIGDSGLFSVTPSLCVSGHPDTHPERCVGTVPGSGVVYVTVGYSIIPATTPFTLTVATAAPLPLNGAIALSVPSSGTITSPDSQFYALNGLTPGTSYTVTLSGLLSVVDLYVYADADFGTLLCTSQNFPPVLGDPQPDQSCTVTAAGTSLFVLVDGFFVRLFDPVTGVVSGTTPFVLTATSP